MEIRPIDRGNQDELRQWYDVRIRAIGSVRTDFVPLPFEQEVERRVLRDEPGSLRHVLVAVEDGRVRGNCSVWLPMEDNLDIAWVLADVDPEHQGRGIGGALVRHAEAHTVPAERSQLHASTWAPYAGWQDAPHVRAVEAMGYRCHSHDVMRHLALPLDTERLRSFVRPTPGYDIEVHVDGVPDDLRESVGVLKGLIDVDAPTGEAEYEPSPLSPEDYAEWLRRRTKDDEVTIETVAVPTGPGAVREAVAYTELILTVGQRDVIQEGTLVRQDHRGHGLGTAVKVANLLALAERTPGNPRISTENNEDNPWMVRINDALGFQPVAVLPYFLKRR